MDTIESLKACPFCGDDGAESAESHIPKIGGGKKWIVFCNDCFCEGPTADTEEEAITAWNNQSLRRQLDDQARQIAELTRERDEARQAANPLFNTLASRLISRVAEATDFSLPDATDIELSLVRIISERDSLKRQLEAAREAAISAVDTLAADYIAEAKKLNEAAAHNGSSLYVSERKPAWAEEVKTAIHKALSTLTDKGEDAQKGGC